MEVAFSTSTGLYIDQPFNAATDFSVWHISSNETCYAYSVYVRQAAQEGMDSGISARADALKQCAIVCARTISTPAAAKLAARHIHPVKTGQPVAVEDMVMRLQSILRTGPAPWLRRIEAGQATGTCEESELADISVADLVCRYPEVMSLIVGPAVALFKQKEDLCSGGVLHSVSHALYLRGISEDLFRSLVADMLRKKRSDGDQIPPGF